jgi:N-acyl-D-aspartate/D-glutamate deacylase
MADLVIRNGLIVDGTGQPGVVGDIAITAGVLTQVGGTVAETGAEEIDATDRIVTPGFVDVHSHYDGQVFFDNALTPSNGHGVTTVVLGLCGVGFAPARPTDHEMLITTMESVEDIPGDVLRVGLPWTWESFPEFLNAVEANSYAMNVAAQIGHIPVRSYVMGERAIANEPATPEDIAAMSAIVREAVDAGAVGFSTSRVLAHRTAAGDPVPGTFAAEDELFGIAGAMAGTGRKVVFQLAQAGIDGFEPESSVAEVEWMQRLSAETGLPVSFLILQTDGAPDLWRQLMNSCVEAEAMGAHLRPQVANRPFGMLLGLPVRHPFMKRKTFRRVHGESATFEALRARLADPEIRTAILSEEDTEFSGDSYEGMGLIATYKPDMVYPLGDDLDYEPLESDSLAARAAAAGVTPLELFYDLMLERDGGTMFLVPMFNYANTNQDDILEMLNHPAALIGLGDGGAHLATICDASMPTYQLSHWVKGRERGPRLQLEAAIKMQTHDTAEFYGFTDRGTLEVGKRADLNVIDMERLTLTMPRAVNDLPTGATRLLQDAIGYDATIVNGVVTRRNDTDTGARPGHLIRGSR